MRGLLGMNRARVYKNIQRLRRGGKKVGAQARVLARSIGLCTPSDALLSYGDVDLQEL